MTTSRKDDIGHHETGINASPPTAAPVQLDDTVLVKMANIVSNLGDITQDAAVATAFEKRLTFIQAIKLYPKPASFSTAMSLSLIMEGYDTSLLGGFFGYPQFQRKFGEPVGDGIYQLTATWPSGLKTAVQVGCRRMPRLI